MRNFGSLFQLLAVVVLIGAAVLAPTPSTGVDQPNDAALKTGAGALDGLAFTTNLGPQVKTGAMRDAMFFRDGRFQSLECEDRCSHSASSYDARGVGAVLEFPGSLASEEAVATWRS